MRKIGAFVIVLFLTSLRSQGQITGYQITHFGEEEGLIQGSIYSISQDWRGVISIGTDIGLYTYDGVRFKQFGIQDGLSDHEVLGITQLNEDLAIFHSFSGQTNIRFRGEIFNSSTNPGLFQLNMPNASDINRLNDSMFILTYKHNTEVSMVTMRKDKVIRVVKGQLPDSFGVISVIARRDNFVIQAAKRFRTCLIQYDIVGDGLKRHKPKYNERPIGLVEFFNDTLLLVYTVSGYNICTYNDTNQCKIYVHENPGVRNLNKTADNSIWVSTFSGALRIQPDGSSDRVMEKTVVNTVFVDRDSNLWIGTHGNGLFLLKPRKALKVFEPKKPDVQVNCVASLDGLKVLGLGNGSIAFLKNERIERTIDIRKGIPKGIIKIHPIERGRLLFTTYKGLFHLNYLKEPIVVDTLLTSESVKCIVDFREGILFGTHAKLSYLRKDLTLEDVYPDRVTSVTVQGQDIWVGTNHGVKRITYSTDSTMEMRHFVKDWSINDLVNDSGDILLATDIGLQRLDTETNTLQPVHPRLDNVNCLKLQKNENSLWIGTHFGLFELVKTIGSYAESPVKRWTRNEGLGSDIVESFLIDQSDIWAISPKGLYVASRKQPAKPQPRMPNILRVTTPQNEFLPTGDSEIEIRLREIDIEFGAPMYNSMVHYEFRLLPGDSEWSETDNNNVRYSRLEPGHYSFQVRTIDNRGETSAINELNILVPSKFYERLWFKLALILFVLGVTVFLASGHFNRRRRREETQLEFERKLAQLEMEAIKSQINPHFMYNCLNSIRYSVISNQQTKAEMQLSIFASLTRKTLDFSRLNFISLDQEVEYLEQYLSMEKLRFKERLSYKVEVQSELDFMLQFPSMIVQPFVENSIKHGLKSREKPLTLNVNFYEEKGNIVCEVVDDGGGFDTEHKRDQNLHGIAMTMTRAETYEALFGISVAISVDSKYEHYDGNTGTRVAIETQISKHSQT